MISIPTSEYEYLDNLPMNATAHYIYVKGQVQYVSFYVYFMSVLIGSYSYSALKVLTFLVLREGHLHVLGQSD